MIQKTIADPPQPQIKFHIMMLENEMQENEEKLMHSRCKNGHALKLLQLGDTLINLNFISIEPYLLF